MDELKAVREVRFTLNKLHISKGWFEVTSLRRFKTYRGLEMVCLFVDSHNEMLEQLFPTW